MAAVDQRYDVLREEVRVALLPEQIAAGPDAVIDGVAGSGLTTMVVARDAWLRHPKLFVTCTV